MMENLAPAGNREALERAVAAGADAVYLGCTAFSARAGAGNFNPDELREAVRFCHLHGVKVHVTVNTLVKDHELDAVTALLRQLANARVDAVLVQDLGILRILRQRFPGLTVHASTQMSLHNLTGVRWAASQGIRRVVLARECSLNEIRLAADGGAEVEVFGHGAQCVSVSGQCLFSSMAGGRSGNRGRCAQPCRMIYDCGGRAGAWLSPRDVCLRNDLPALAEAGVASVKIEGRLKRPEYVATVTASYRKGLDALERGEFQPADEDEMRALRQIFSRGGFMRGRAMGCEDAAFIDPDRVNHGGVQIGLVEQADPRFASLRVSLPLHDGDQLRIETKRGDYEAIYAGKETAAGDRAVLRLRENSDVRAGDPVARLTDSEQLREAMAMPLPTIPAHFSLTAMAGEPLSLTASSADVTVTVTGARAETAEKNPLTQERARQQLEKTGNTGFAVVSCAVKTGDAFVAASALNALRRDALERLTEAICERRAPMPSEEKPEDSCVLPGGGCRDIVTVHRAFQLNGLPQGAAEALERRLDDVVRVRAVELPQVQRHGGGPGKGEEELLRKLRIEGADLLRGQREVIAEGAPTGEIDGAQDERLVHRQEHAAVAADAPLVAQRLAERLAQGDADVLGAVVVVHICVSLADDGKIEPPVAGKQREHMVQEAHAGIDLRLSRPVQAQAEGDVGLGGLSFYLGASHIATPLSVSIARTAPSRMSICALVPTVMRVKSRMRS